MKPLLKLQLLKAKGRRLLTQQQLKKKILSLRWKMKLPRKGSDENSVINLILIINY
jgi:hypothetical protein